MASMSDSSRFQVTSSAPLSIRAMALWLVPARSARRRWLRPCLMRRSLIRSPGFMMPYTVSELEDLTAGGAAGDADQPHGVPRRATALGRAARVEDLEAVFRLLVQRRVGVAEDDDIRALAEARSHAL